MPRFGDGDRNRGGVRRGDGPRVREAGRFWLCPADFAPDAVHEEVNDQPVKPHEVSYDRPCHDPVFDKHEAKVL